VYPELAALYAPHGGRVPDLRGMFLRGHGSQAFNSGGYGNVGHASGALGQIQGDAVRNISGNMAGFLRVHPFEFGASGAFWDQLRGWDNGYSGGGWSGSMRMGFDAARQVPTANENRPVNMAVRYLIRAAS